MKVRKEPIAAKILFTLYHSLGALDAGSSGQKMLKPI
jgi:hypothetical protein